jgi:tetratricopeptide (TPR) repeat protein
VFVVLVVLVVHTKNPPLKKGGFFVIDITTQADMNQKNRLVAGLICGNEAERIERCVKSLQKVCDEIVIIRAVGSLQPDETKSIAKGLGCYTGEYLNSPLCRHWPHLDDFAAARNMAFEKAYDLAGENGWVTWADCDDVLKDNMVEPTLKALRDCPPECDWILSDYVIPEQNKRAPRERFFRYRTGWWWRAVHENVHPTKTIKIHMRRDVEIHHMPPLGQRKSNERNQRILEWQDQFAPHWKFYLHYEKMITNQRDLSLRYGAEALAMKGLDGVHKYETLMNMSNMTDGDSALRFAQAARKLDPERREAVALEASILLDAGKPAESLALLDEMDKIPVPAFTQWTHKAEYYGGKAKQLRAWALRMAGKKEEAFKLEMQVLDAAPRPRISLLHATRGRPLQAAQNMNLWLTRASKPERVEHIFAVDSDDESAALLQRFAGVCQEPDGFSVGAWNLAAQHSTGDILVQFSDDFECPPGWDDMLESRLDISKEKVLHISDGHRTDELLAMVICTRKYYKAHGLFNPQFRNQYSDAEFTVRAAKVGAIVDARDIVCVHHHPAFENIPTDETYARVNDPKESTRAKEIFEKLTK